MFPPIINDFGGSSSVRGNTGPFWIGSGLALLSALIVLVGVRPLSHDGMMEEDEKVSIETMIHGSCAYALTPSSVHTWRRMVMILAN
jgi:hypothetical protein